MARPQFNKTCAYCGAPFTVGTNNKKQRHCSSRCGASGPPPAERFWAKVQKTETCWLWIGGLNSDGYGSFWPAKSIGTKTHRFSWELHNGPIPLGMCVCHRCDVPACVRPDHLFLGTQNDNIADMMAKGRHATSRGEDNTRAKLTSGQILSIRSDTRYQKTIAAEYGITQAQVSKIKLRTAWAHI